MSDREIANILWLRIKGKPIPDFYTDEDCEQIIYRYWHKCMEGQKTVFGFQVLEALQRARKHFSASKYYGGFEKDLRIDKKLFHSAH